MFVLPSTMKSTAKLVLSRKRDKRRRQEKKILLYFRIRQ